MTFSSSLKLLVLLAVPAAGVGLYAHSREQGFCCPLLALANWSKPAPCACCCETPSGEELVAAFAEGKDAGGSDCPMFGGTPQRNLVNLIDKNVPTMWSVEEGKEKNIKWIAKLGDKAFGGPVIANGKIYVGTSNGAPRDPKIKGYRAVLMAFNEADGKFLWQIVHQSPQTPTFKMGLSEGLCSTPVVEGDGIFYVTPGCEVVRATPEGKIVWKYDMLKELKVHPFHLSNCSPLIAGDLLMLMTSNGREDNGALPSPKAPSFIAVNKNTGKLAWQSSLPGENILEGQWSNPALAVVAGKPQVIFPGGDGVLYSFEPETGKLIWKFNAHSVRPKEGEPAPYFVATPVIHGDRLYIGMGVGPDLGNPTKTAHFLCIDITKTGDASPKNLNAKDPANKGSALVWSFGGPIEPRPKTGLTTYFTPSINTCAVHDGLVYAVEERGVFHCADAKTGERYWTEDLKTNTWSSPYYVDGKVYMGCQDGSVFIFAHGKNKKLLNTIDHFESIDVPPVVANGVLYIATRSKLIAIAEKK
jgi:outer membrane protein assembly factor BamB